MVVPMADSNYRVFLGRYILMHVLPNKREVHPIGPFNTVHEATVYGSSGDRIYCVTRELTARPTVYNMLLLINSQDSPLTHVHTVNKNR